MPTFATAVKEFERRLKLLSQQIGDIGHIDDVFWQMNALLEADPKIGEVSTFWTWLNAMYAGCIAVRIRRLADRDSRNISLWRLLEDMKKWSSDFTREWFLNMHPTGFHNIAEKWFNEWAGAGNDRISANEFTAKQNELDAAVDRVRQYANTNVAHFAEPARAVSVTFGEIRNSIVSVWRVYNSCGILLKSESLRSPVPTLLTNWLIIFERPWLKPGSYPPRYTHLEDLIPEIEKNP